MPERLWRGGAAAVLAALAALSCRRETAGPSGPSAPAAAATPVLSDGRDVASRQPRAAGAGPSVIWLGLDGLDFQLVDRLAAEGRMPNWKRFEAEGYTARLESFVPAVSPVVWTTLATGVSPEVHRVLDFQEVDPATGQKVPISGRSRAVPAIWNVASAQGLSVGVVGWWATHPAEAVRGFFVSDRASPILFEGLPRDGVAYPEALAAGVEQVVSREGRVSDEELARFVDVPAAEIARARASGEGPENPIVGLARTVAATRTQSRIARELYDRNVPDLMMVYFEGTDVVGHLFASYLLPKMDCVSRDEIARYGRAVDEYFGFVDRVLGQWMRRAEEDGATLVVASDHGFKWGEDRSCERGSLSPAAHRLEGVLAAMGPAVRKGAPRGRASVYDVEPTVAALLGLPVDVHAAGTPIRAVAGDRPAPARRDLAADVPVRRLEARPMSASEAGEYAKTLVALGYLSASDPGRLSPSGGERPGMTEKAWNNLGLYHFAVGGAKHLASAEAAYREALRLRPDYATAKINLAVLHRERGEDGLAIDGLFDALAAGQGDSEGAVLDWTRIYGAEGKPKRAREVLERGVRVFPDSERLGRALALEEYKAKRCAPADAALGRFEAATQSPETLNALAVIRACLGRREDAARLFRKSLALKPGQETVVHALAVLEGAGEGRREGS
jgi:predicted AlkP superfamily phosphohydrolase/phosphomutase